MMTKIEIVFLSDIVYFNSFIFYYFTVNMHLFMNSYNNIYINLRIFPETISGAMHFFTYFVSGVNLT